MINGNQYAWEDIRIVFPGNIAPIDDVVSIEYETTKEHTEIYGRGSKPVYMGRGKESHKATVTILQSRLEAIQISLPKGKKITDMAPFTITVSYAPEGSAATTDQILFCRVKSVKKGMKQGDTNMEIPLELAVGDIEYNV
jgi:hypothetical protein